jgi:hypothetical protein
MTKYTKTQDGKYLINGTQYEKLVGSRAQVWHNSAFKTSGSLKRKQLFQNKNGRIVSKNKHNTAKKENRLVKHGFGTKKGKFGVVLLKKTRKNKKVKKGKKTKRRL